VATEIRDAALAGQVTAIGTDSPALSRAQVTRADARLGVEATDRIGR
jgi:hypothetical protein